MKKNNLINNINYNNKTYYNFLKDIVKFLGFLAFILGTYLFLLIKQVNSKNLHLSNYSDDQIEIAIELQKKGNYVAAEEVLLNAYSNGNKEAAYNLGWLYNVENKFYDLKKVYGWWELAALSGDKRAIYNIAIAYSEGKFYEKDVNKAIELFIYVAEYYNDAFIIIGDIYRMDKAEYEQAAYFYTKALKAKEKDIKKDAHAALASLYFSDEYLDFLKGFEHAELAANYGDKHSLFAIGTAYVKLLRVIIEKKYYRKRYN